MGSGDVHTFLFADLAGFTALTEAHGDEEAAQLASEFCSRVRRLLPDYGAKEIKTIGDAVMVRVPSPRDAVLLGLSIVDEIRALSRFPIVRVGMHTGTAVERSGDWYGATVNLAARISAVAGGNEVLLSEATRKAAELSSGVELQRRGPQSFKNVGEAVVIYRALRSGDWRGPVAIDPVCRMAVDPAHAAGKLAHDGVEYDFCSLECAAAFAADPERYLPER